MKIQLNGKPEEIKDGMTLKDLLDQMHIKPELVACEVNLAIVRRKDCAAHKISEGDQIEILQMIGGG